MIATGKRFRVKNFYSITFTNPRSEILAMFDIKVITKLGGIMYWKKPEDKFGDIRKVRPVGIT